MTLSTEHLMYVFMPQLLAGMAVNFKIAAIALFWGLVLGVPLATARLAGYVTAAAASALIGLLRAAPTFVVMFFLFNVIAKDAKFFGITIALSDVMTVALSLLPYAAAYVADNGADALQQWRRGAPLAALLFLPNIGRSFFVLVMSSSAGAAIGVGEGIAVILREAERLPTTQDKFLLFAIGIACFGVALQAGFAMINLLKLQIGKFFVRNDA